MKIHPTLLRPFIAGQTLLACRVAVLPMKSIFFSLISVFSEMELWLPEQQRRRSYPSILRYHLVVALLLANVAGPAQTSRAPQTDAPGEPSLTTRIQSARVFYEPLVPVGSPSDEENLALWAVIEKMRARGPAFGVTDLDRFISANTNSAWLPSLQANLARYHREHGRYGKALQYWEAAWKSTRAANAGPEKRIADFTFAHWTSLLASLGRVETLHSLYDETQGRQFNSGGPLQQTINSSKEAYRTMLNDPGDCFKCGTFALSAVAKMIKGPKFNTGEVLKVPSPSVGFTMTALLQISREAGLDLVPVRWSEEKLLVVPCVLHWKEQHFAALLDQRDGYFLVADPTFGQPKWLARADIVDESSGSFLLPSDRVPTGWQQLSRSETDQIYGRGRIESVPDNDDSCGNGSGGADPPQTQLLDAAENLHACPSCGGGGGGGGGGGAGQACCPGGDGSQGGNAINSPPLAITEHARGTPVWEVSEPYINLWLYDEPLGYRSGLGYPISFKLAYKQRESRDVSDSVFGLGPMWNCSWLSFVKVDYSPTMVLPGGGIRYYKADGTIHDRFDRSTMLQTTDVSNNLTGFIVSYANGAKDYYGFVPTNTFIDMAQVAFLSCKVDPYGHTNRFIYAETSTNLLLRYVIDADCRTNSLTYTNSSFSSQITGVSDPFGRTTILKYSADGLLTNITDVAGLSSSFTYDSQAWITALATPYGTTTFEHIINPNGINGGDSYLPIRTVRIVDPMGGTNIYMLRQDSSLIYTNSESNNTAQFLPNDFDGTIAPTNLPAYVFENDSMNFRDTFHWGPRQAAGLPDDVNYFPLSAYKGARLRHWFHKGGGIGHSLGMQRDPSPDGSLDGQTVWFGFTEEDFIADGGEPFLFGAAGRVLSDGTTRYTWLRRDEWGHPTNIVETYSSEFGNTASTRTNIFTYDANGIDLRQHLGPRGEAVARYTYDNKHQLLGITNAVGDVTTFEYDSAGRLTRTISPTGLESKNLYFASGEYTNWVATNILVQIGRTNSFTYTNNLLLTHTDERGVTTSNYWDNLQRLLTTTDPRGTISYLYTNLDLVRVIDRMGFSNSFVYDNVRRVTAKTNELGFFTLYNYCNCGALDSIRDAEGNFTYFFYDNAGRLLRTVHADGYSTTNNFNVLGQITNTCDTAGTSVTNWFNNQGLRYAVSTAAGNREFITFDDEDRATNIVNADGVSTDMTYDELGRLRTRTYPDSGVEKFGYSAAGPIAYTNQIGLTNFFTYDAGGRKTFETNANREIIGYTYNSSGDLLTLTDGRTNSTTWHYDQYGHVTNKVDQAGSEILRYGYDANNRLISRWSAAKGTTYYTNDAVGNLLNINYPTSDDVSFAYDALNRRTNMVDGVGTTKYTYTAAGQLLTEDGPFASDTVTNIYSNRLRVEMGLQQPTGLWTNRFAWDPVKRLTNVTSTAGSFGYQYEPSFPTRLIAKLLLPNTAYISNAFDADARILGTYLKNNSGTVLDSYVYAYNPANQRTNLTRADTTGVAYSYDKIGQLTIANDSAGSGTYSRGYAYDASWNLIRRTNFCGGPPNCLESFTNDVRNQLTDFTGETAHYDANGNLTNRISGDFVLFTYTYDDENRLTFMEYDDWGTPYFQLGQMEYDGLGRLRAITEYIWMYDGSDYSWVPTDVKTYVYDGWRVIQERDENNTPTVSYTRGSDLSGSLEGAGGIGGLLARSCGYSSGNWSTNSFYFADGNGNVVCMLDGSQSMVASYRYDPFGHLMSAGGSLASDNSYRFSSKEILAKNLDAYGALYYYGYRFYDPYLQRWINRDQVQEQTGRTRARKLMLQVLAGWNLYEFCHNDAVERVDSNGFLDWSWPAIKHDLSEFLTPIGFGGQCCNYSGKDTFWVDNGVWKALPDGKCTAWNEDCDGYMCGGQFYPVSNPNQGFCLAGCQGSGPTQPLPNPRAPNPPPKEWKHGLIAAPAHDSATTR